METTSRPAASVVPGDVRAITLTARSKPVAQTVAEVAGLLAAGFREIVLVGIHLGAWGQTTTRDAGPRRLGELLGPLLELNAPNGKPTRMSSGFKEPMSAGPDVQLRRILPCQLGDL